ncbi:hypothetical protein T07_1999 [Trichinella nelsoni]|uniref:Uncharacterized protein n=1 Tax=Trichinella nelsoni TaxID=6336 RepID=A0A0V0RL42_9BILA|nr:hypothetical protein T07_1999 [Trichinella nelsoni]
MNRSESKMPTGISLHEDDGEQPRRCFAVKLTQQLRPLPSMQAERYKSSVKHCVGVVSCPSTLTHRRFTEIA